MRKAILVLPMLALTVLSLASVMAEECSANPTIPKFSISANGGELTNIGAFNNFTFSKASVDLWSNGRMQSLGSVMLVAENKGTKERVNLNLHLVPVGSVCDDGIWSYTYLAHGTYWVKGTLPKQVYVWVDYSMSTDGKFISMTGEGIDGLNFKVNNMPMVSKI